MPWLPTQQYKCSCWHKGGEGGISLWLVLINSSQLWRWSQGNSIGVIPHSGWNPPAWAPVQSSDFWDIHSRTSSLPELLPGAAKAGDVEPTWQCGWFCPAQLCLEPVCLTSVLILTYTLCLNKGKKKIKGQNTKNTEKHQPTNYGLVSIVWTGLFYWFEYSFVTLRKWHLKSYV